MKENVLSWDFEEVYREHFSYVYRLVARLGGRTDAEDLCQEVFLVVHRRLREFEGKANLRTWLFQICYRVVGAHLRRTKVRRALGLELAREPRIVRCIGPEHVERDQLGDALLCALETLSWKKRATLLLHDVEGWTCRQIAAGLQVPEATVQSRLLHGRKDLAAKLSRFASHLPPASWEQSANWAFHLGDERAEGGAL